MAFVKKWWSTVRPTVIGTVIYAIVRVVCLTVRLRVEGEEAVDKISGGKVFATWHGRTFLATDYFRGQGVWTIISHSKDGAIQNRIFSLFGFKTIRGSSSRGGVRAAIEAIKVLRDGHTMAFTPDGPRGPSGVVQPGIMLMAQKSGAALIPGGVSARPRKLMSSWDRYLLPCPFGRALFLVGEPIYVPSDADDATVEQLRLQLEAEMHRLEAEAERRLERGERRA